jgi:hypothetical protein
MRDGVPDMARVNLWPMQNEARAIMATDTEKADKCMRPQPHRTIVFWIALVNILDLFSNGNQR